MYFGIVSNWIVLKTVFIMSWHLMLYRYYTKSNLKLMGLIRFEVRLNIPCNGVVFSSG